MKITVSVRIYTMEKRGRTVKYNNDMDLRAQMNTDAWWRVMLYRPIITRHVSEYSLPLRKLNMVLF